MATAKITKGYTLSDKRRGPSALWRCIYGAFVGCSLLILLSVGIAIGYISRVNIESLFGSSMYSSRISKDDKKQEVDGINSGIRMNRSPLEKSGMEFSGYNRYKIDDFEDKPDFSISFWFRLPNVIKANDLFLIGNRDIQCSGENCKGFVIYFSVRTSKLRIVWQSKDIDSATEVVTSGRVYEKVWHHVVLVLDRHNSTITDGFYPISLECYFNGHLSVLRRSQFGSAGKAPLYVGGSPSNTYHHYGRIYSVMISNTVFSDKQVTALHANYPEDIRKILTLCQGMYLTRSESAPKYKGEKTDAPAPIGLTTGSSHSLARSRKRRARTPTASEAVKRASIRQKEKANEKKEKHVETTAPATIAEVENLVSKTQETPNLLKEYTHRQPFIVTKSSGNLRSDSYPPPPPFKDELCSGIPPKAIPQPTGALQSYIERLLSTDEQSLKEGSFSNQVPNDLYEDYHYLSEYRAKHVRDAFCFAWGNYHTRTWGADEMHPVDGTPGKDWGGIGMTLLDSVDTLKILGLEKEFEAATEWVETEANFEMNLQSPVFEFNIRIVGGMLAAYDLSKNKVFLDKAQDMADRLLPAFSTPSGYPKSFVNLQTGVATLPSWTQNKVILSELGTMSVEFLYLSHHTGNVKYKKAIDSIYDTLKRVQTQDGLLPTFMNPVTGEAAHGDLSMGAMADSYYEYLLKMWIQTGKKDETIRRMYNDAVEGLTKRLLKRSSSGLLYCGLDRGPNQFKAEMGHLTCFLGGMLALGVLHNVNPATADRDLANAKSLGYTCYLMYSTTETGISGEAMLFRGNTLSVNSQASYYILRPEALETLYYLNQITRDPIYREWGWKMWSSIERECRTTYGYGHLRDVRKKGSIDNRAESFFFAETSKYAYLLFKDEKIVDLVKQVLNTEAHPLSVLSESS